MEFRFNIGQYFKGRVAQIKNNLIPIDFHGDRRTLLDTTSKFSEIINDMGEASARAQGLTRPVTTAQKLRNSDHTVYLMYEEGGKNGLVTGLLKIGKKLLYVFDGEGETHTVDAPCVLDFYIHDSRQRYGLGKELFQCMLTREGYQANQLAIDRPSDKLLAFLRKHYRLEKKIPQMNNFVIYDGFFELNNNGAGASDRNNNSNSASNNNNNNNSSSSINMSMNGGLNLSDSSHKYIATTPTMMMERSPIGRYAARRPMGSMAEIIHNSPLQATMTDDSDRY